FFAIVWLPGTFACFSSGLRQRGILGNRWLYGAAGFWTLSCLGGHFAPFAHTAVALLFACFVRDERSGTLDWRDHFKKLLFTGCVAGLWLAPQLLPTLEYLAGAYRWV